MSLAISAIVVGTALVYNQYEQGEKARKVQEQALQESKRQADQQAKVAEQNFNKANAKSPDVASIMSAAQQAAKGGASGTMLTGPQGIDPNALSLSKNTLLGM